MGWTGLHVLHVTMKRTFLIAPEETGSTISNWIILRLSWHYVILFPETRDKAQELQLPTVLHGRKHNLGAGPEQ